MNKFKFLDKDEDWDSERTILKEIAYQLKRIADNGIKCVKK